MTILVAYKKSKDKIIYGSDSYAIHEYIKKEVGDKWVKINFINGIKRDEMVIGITGNGCYYDFFKHTFECPNINNEDNFTTYLYKVFIPSLNRQLTNINYIKNNNGKLDTDSNFIILYDDIYVINNDLMCYSWNNDFGAFGIGQEMAIGSFEMYKKYNSFVDKEVLKDVIDICIKNSSKCNGKPIVNEYERR